MNDRQRINEVLGLLMLQNNLLIQAGEACCTSCATHECTRDGLASGCEGYAYYHMQDAEAFDEQGTLRDVIHIGFGSLLNKEVGDDDVLIGHLVADRMRAAGFEVEWNGTYRERIGVRPRQ